MGSGALALAGFTSFAEELAVGVAKVNLSKVRVDLGVLSLDPEPGDPPDPEPDGLFRTLTLAWFSFLGTKGPTVGV